MIEPPAVGDGSSFARAVAIVTAFEAAGETSAARLLLVSKIQDLIDAAADGAAPPKGALPMDEQFFIVWNPNGMGPPRFRHPTLAAAEKESLRLARENPGHRFYVMGNLGHAARPDPVFTPVHPPQLSAIDANVGEMTAGAVSGALNVAPGERKPARVLKHGEYEPGDIVRYTGRGSSREESWMGLCGRVVTVAGLTVYVNFYNVSPPPGQFATRSVAIENIEHEGMPQFQSGDLVEEKPTARRGFLGSLCEGRWMVQFNTGFDLVWPCDLELVVPVQHRDGAR